MQSKRWAFTLTEILVVIGVLTLLAAILLPVLAAARERGRRTACLANVRQLGTALTMYVQDADGLFPPRSEGGDGERPEWDDALLAYARSRTIFCCPDCQIPPLALSASGMPENIANGYAFNFELSGATLGPRVATAEATVPFPSTTVAFCEVSYRTGVGKNPGETSVGRIINTNSSDTGEGLDLGETIVGPSGAVRHQGGSDYGFVDGHVRWYRPEQVSAADADTPTVNNGSVPTFAR